MSLKEKIFNEPLNQPVVHEALRWYLASRRRGTHSAKTRTEVSGGGKKPWKQKGTGRARAGSTRSPLWRHGGVIFPPKPRDYSYALPVKMRKLALRVALSELNRADKVKVAEALVLPAPKTKEGVKFLKEQGVAGKVLILQGKENKEFVRGIQNIAGVKVMPAKDVNIYEILKSDWVIVEKEAVKQLEERIR
ncbi:MAG: 50S ribosomal protein L4 [Candidatus Margulisbacteria bacterium]|nr:50S ribosomal protein L4 [Candidatus Margulisiibacteriota bacterium]